MSIGNIFSNPTGVYAYNKTTTKIKGIKAGISNYNRTRYQDY